MVAQSAPSQGGVIVAGAAFLVLGRSCPAPLSCPGEGEHMCGGGLGRRYRRGR